ncbi:hypothetical protein FRC07_007582, partial [Ceratobasidium sp. 392]
MARHRATRPSVASAISTASTNGTRTRTKLSYEQNALLALAESNLKRNKKPLNISAIVKDAERRAHEQGLELGVRARPRIKKAVEKLPTEHGSPEYDAPGEFDFGADAAREMTPPTSSPPDAVEHRRVQQVQTFPQKSELELKMERLEASMSELALEKAQMAEEIVALKNQVEHERQNASHLIQVQHEADLVRVELAQTIKDRDLALKDAMLLTQDNAILEGQRVDLTSAKERLDITVSQLNADLTARIASESEAQTSLINTTRELEATKHSLALVQDDVRRTNEEFAVAKALAAVQTDTLATRDATIAELHDARDLTSEQLQTLRSEVQALRDNLALANDRALRAETAVKERELQVSGLNAEQEALQGTIEGLQAHIDRLVNEKTELLAQVEAMKASAERDLAKIAELDNEIEGLNAQVDSLHGDLDAAQFDREQLQAKAEADNAAAGRFIAQRDATIAERDVQLAKLTTDLKSQSQELSKRQKRIGQLDAALSESSKTIASLRSSQKVTEAELAASIKKVEELNGTIADLRVQDQASKKHIGELKADLVKHKDALEEHQDVISKLELQLDRLREIELQSLRRRRARIEAEAKRLRDEEDDLTRETIDVDQWD